MKFVIEIDSENDCDNINWKRRYPCCHSHGSVKERVYLDLSNVQPFSTQPWLWENRVSSGELTYSTWGKEERKIIFKSSFGRGYVGNPGRVKDNLCFHVHEGLKSAKSWIQTGHFTGKHPVLWGNQDVLLETVGFFTWKKHHELQGSHNTTSPNNVLLRGSPSKLAWVCSVWWPVWSPKQGVIPRLIPPYPKAQHLPPRWKRLIRKSRMYWSSNAAAALTHGCWWWQTFIKTAAWMWNQFFQWDS